MGTLQKGVQAIGLGSLLLLSTACTIFATRPVQEMSDTQATLKAAREVQADTLAPELYRNANEWFLKARREYKLKNFHLSREYAERARFFAEEAEFEAIRNGGARSGDQAPSDPLSNGLPPPPPPQEMPRPEGTPADVFDQRRTEDEAARKKALDSQAPSSPGLPGFNPVQPSPTPTF